jgi:hypothetical protein
MARTKLLLPVIVATALGLAACGSTVQTANTVAGTSNDSLAVPGSTAPSAAAGSGLSVPTAGGAAAAAGGSAVTGGGSTAAGTGPTGSTTSSGSGPVTSGGGSTGLAPSRAPGVTNSKVYMGIPYSSQAASGDRAIGAAGAAPSYDGRDVYNAVINYANKHGGFAGRQLAPLYYDYNLTDDTSSQDQAACAHWTQDNKVAAIVTGSHDILTACAEHVSALPIDLLSSSDFQRFPHLVDPEGISLNRIGAVTTTGLERAHYFTGKLGLVTWDDARYKASINDGYMPVLNKYGIKVWQTAYINVPQTLGALSDTTAAVSSAINKFRALGIDHVIIQDGHAGVFNGAGLTLEWMDQAKSQHYKPRYGQNSGNAPGWAVLPADQMDNALAIDNSDDDVKFDKGWHANPQRDKCFKIEANAGYAVHSSNENDEGIAAQACDIVFMFQRAMNGVSVVSNDSLVQAISGFGKTLGSALVYGNNFFPGRRDGGDMVRTEIYHKSCQCLQFMGQPYWAG